MKRLKMLEKAQQIACEQISMSSSLPDERYKELRKLPTEEALYTLAHQILENSFFNMECTLREIRRE